MGHCASKCEEELPTNTAKNRSNMLITDEDSSVELNQEKDDEEPDNGQYQEREETNEDTDQEGGKHDINKLLEGVPHNMDDMTKTLAANTSSMKISPLITTFRSHSSIMEA